MTSEPTHLVITSGDRTTVCGLVGPQTPYVLAEHAPRHVAGRGMVVCTTCTAGWLARFQQLALPEMPP